MVTVPLGQGAYKRQQVRAPEIRLENRYMETSPSNLREHTALIGRPGTNPLVQCAGGIIRGMYSKPGLFNGDLFVVSGPNFWRVSATTGLATQITGTIANDGNPYFYWSKGIGWENLFISDGSTLQYFNEHAKGTFTLSGNIQEGMVIDINGVYYGWSANVDHNSPAGTVTNPYWANLATQGVDQAANNTQSLANMVLAILDSGVPGADYSSAIAGPNASVTMTSDELHLYVQAIDNTTAGNSITTSVTSSGGGALTVGGATLSGGGGTALASVTGMGANEVSKALAGTSLYVLVSVGNTSKFYWINPGETVIDPLNFASKESNPDNILDMVPVGDQVLISGNGSAENWYATGNFVAPFAPVEGRVYQRGIIEGTPVQVNDSVILVGNDGVVYSVGYAFGQTGQWGVHRISTHAIEERIRVQLRREQLLPP